MAAVYCPHCSGAAECTSPVGVPTPLSCPHCRTSFTVERFPAHGRGFQPGQTGAPSTAEDATCFVHVDKRAESSCDECGRFMCALCEIRVGGRHLCPTCFGGGAKRSGAKTETSGPFERNRSLPGRLAFWMALGSAMLGPLAIIGGPLAVFFAIRGWRRPGSITGRRPTALAVIGLIIGGIETLAGIAVVIGLSFGIWEAATQ